MSYKITSIAGVLPPGSVSSTQELQLGTIAQGRDETLGAGEFIYLKGAANTTVGMAVIYNTYAGTTVLATAASRGPTAIALGSTVASTYGWYQISGTAVVKSGTVAAGGVGHATGTPGTVDDAVVVGDKIDGLVFKAADADGFATAQLSRPSMNGNDLIV